MLPFQPCRPRRDDEKERREEMDFGKKILAYSSTFGIVWLERKIVESDYERIKCFVLDFNISGRKDVVRSFPTFRTILRIG